MADATPGQVESPSIQKQTQTSEALPKNRADDADKIRLFKRAVGDLYGEKKSRAFKSKGPKLSGLQKMADWMNSDEVKKMGVGATLVQGIEADRAKKQQEEKKKDDDKGEDLPPPAPTPEDNPPPPPFIPEPLKTEYGMGIATHPEHIEQEVGEMGQHDRSKDKPGRGNGIKDFLVGMASPILHPGEFGRNFVQNALLSENFDRRSRSFSKSMLQIARKDILGLDESIPYDLPLEVLDRAKEEAKKIKASKNWFARRGMDIVDIPTGIFALGQNSEMRLAEKWFKENGKDMDLLTQAKKTSFSEQTELGERFALKGDNKDVISSQVGEVRYTLDQAIADAPTKQKLQSTIKSLISDYVQNPNDEELLKRFNDFYHKEIFPKISPEKQKEIEGGIELSSNILRIAQEMIKKDEIAKGEFKTKYQRYQDEKDGDETMWNKLHFDVYLGKGKYDVARGEVRLSNREKKIIHMMAESGYKVASDDKVDRAWTFVKETGTYVVAYAVGYKMAALTVGKSFAHVGGMLVGSVTAGLREGVLFSKEGGKLVGLRGKAVNNFEQVSRETASGRKSKKDAKLRPMFEKAMVDQVKATDLIGSIDSQLQKETLSVDEQKQLLQALAHAKARLTMTDLSTKKGKALFDTIGEIDVAQNFIGFSVDNNNAEMTALRARIIQGGVKLATSNPELYGKLNDCQAIYESQLRVGSFEDKVIAALAKDNSLSLDEARAKFADLFDNLGIDNKDRKSLEASAKTLAWLVDKKALTTAGFALVISPIMGAEMKIIGEAGSGFGALITGHIGEWGDNWHQVVTGGAIPLTYDKNHDLQSGLSPLQKDVLGIENLFKPQGGEHVETIDGVQVALPGGVEHGFIQGHPDEDALVDTRSGEVLVHMDKSTLFYNEQGELMVKNDITGGSDKASVVFAAFEKNGIHLVPDPGHDVKVPGGGEEIFHAGALHPDNSVVVDGKHVSTTIPDNTHWKQDDIDKTKWDLMGSNKDGTPRTLIDNATIKSNGEIDVQGATVESTVHIDPGTPVTSGGGSEKLFDHALTNRIVWGHNGHSPPIETTDRSNEFATGDPDHPFGIAIRFPDDTFRNPDLNTSDPLAISSFQKAYDNHELSALLEIKGLHGVNDGHIILKDCFVKEGDHFVLNLDPTSDQPIQLGDGTTVTMGEIARAILNEDELKKHPIGPLDSEFTGQFNVLKLGNNGQLGHILMGTTPEDKNLYGFEPIDSEQKIFLALHEYTGSEEHDGNALINTGSGGETTFHATINADDIFKDSEDSSTLGYKIEYDQSANLLLNLLSGLRPVPIRENVEKSVRGEAGVAIPPIPQPKPTPTPQPVQDDPNEARKKLEKIAAKIEKREKLLNLKEITPEQLSEDMVVEGHVSGSGGIKYDKTTPDDEEEYEIYGKPGEGFIRAVLENPYLTVNYIDEKNKKSIPVRANKGVKLELKDKVGINGIFMVGTDFCTINVVTGVFEKISDEEAERIRKLDWVWFD